MTTLTDLPARVEEALRWYQLHKSGTAALGINAAVPVLIDTLDALAADWQHLRERERVLTEALQFYGHAPHWPAFALHDRGETARAALSPEPKT